MIVINTVNAQKFSKDGIEYFKNFTPVVAGDSVRIVNTYDSRLEIVPSTNYANFTVDGSTYGSAALLQSALLPVLFTRDNLGGGGSTTFTGLTDTPSSYTGQANKKVVVNGGETALEFVDDVAGGGLTVIQCPRRISLSSINTWYSHYQNSNTSWLDGGWTRTSGTGATPSRVQANFQNTGAYYIENMTQMDSLDLYIRTASADTHEVIVYSYDFSTNDGNEVNEQILVQETFTIPTNGTSHVHSFTINAHSFSNPTIIQVFIRNTTGTGNFDNPFFTYKFS